MLGIEFLNRSKELRFDGQEFMDYQKGDLFKDLIKLFEKVITPDDRGGYSIDRTNKYIEELKAGIFSETGIKVSLGGEQIGGVGVDVGFMNPGNLLDVKNAQDFFSANESNIGRAFKRLKTDVLKGWVDTSTGKVGGDFSKITFPLYIDDYVSYFVNKKFLARYNVTMAEALTSAVVHELGHIFTGLLYIYRTVIDPIISTTAIKAIVDGKAYGKERVEIVKEAFKAMDVTQKVNEEDISDFTGDEFIVYFNKAVGTRDTRRTLSLGTQDRSSEIYADLYAVRMGCPKQFIAQLVGMGELPGYGFSFPLISTACSAIVITACNPVLGALCGINSIFMLLMYFNINLVPGSTYDAPYRRVKTILRDYVVRLNATKGVDPKAKALMLKDAKEMEKIVDDAKPFLEGTWAQRTVGYIFNGSDFRAQEFEHYTDELIGHTLSLYKNAI